MDERLKLLLLAQTAFVAEVNKELDFDLNASSPIHVSVVENRDLYLTCAFTKPLRRHRISFLSLKDFGLLYIGHSAPNPNLHTSFIFCVKLSMSHTLVSLISVN